MCFRICGQGCVCVCKHQGGKCMLKRLEASSKQAATLKRAVFTLVSCQAVGPSVDSSGSRRTSADVLIIFRLSLCVWPRLKYLQMSTCQNLHLLKSQCLLIWGCSSKKAHRFHRERSSLKLPLWRRGADRGLPHSQQQASVVRGLQGSRPKCKRATKVIEPGCCWWVGGANAPVWYQCPEGAQSYQPTNEGCGSTSAQLLDTEWEDTDNCGNPGSEAPLLILMFVFLCFCLTCKTGAEEQIFLSWRNTCQCGANNKRREI